MAYTLCSSGGICQRSDYATCWKTGVLFPVGNGILSPRQCLDRGILSKE